MKSFGKKRVLEILEAQKNPDGTHRFHIILSYIQGGVAEGIPDVGTEEFKREEDQYSQRKYHSMSKLVSSFIPNT